MSDLWGPIDIRRWTETPHVRGRLATEQDVRNGRAVFFLNSGSRQQPFPRNLPIPCCGIQIDPQSRSETPVVVIQAESIGEECTVGVRYLDGGNGVCTLEEVQLLPGPDEGFKGEQSG